MDMDMLAEGHRDRDGEAETHMRYLAADSPVEDVMMGRRLDTRFIVSGESMGHRVNRCAYIRLKKPSISVIRRDKKRERVKKRGPHRAQCPRPVP
jgi:hypothetical protein